MRKIIGNLIISIGILFLFGALLLLAYNRWEDIRAEETAAVIAEQLEAYRNEPSYLEVRRDSDTEMQEVLIDGIAYIGSLQIPTLGLELPVISEWNYDNLGTAPCRYVGSAYSETMVIAGLDYTRHFGELNLLQKGTQIIFIDINNNTFFYEIEESEVLHSAKLEEMVESEYDLTLVTCIYDGSASHVIRCSRVEDPDNKE